MSSSPQTSTRTTGTHRTHRAHREARDRGAARTLAHSSRSSLSSHARYEPHLDGLFTYCLSALCDHDAATAALGDVLALAERRGGRGPEAPGDRRAWLYALARWACLRKLAEAKRKRRSSHAAGRPVEDRGDTETTGTGAGGLGTGTGAETGDHGPPVPPEVRRERRRELSLLAWPEAAGTTPEQREALELAVRHHLTAHEVAAVLGMEPPAARELLASAACEVERTRAALAVAETGTCPGVTRLTGGHEVVLSAPLRRELVRHVDDCPRCRRTAEHAIPGHWPGTSVTPAELPVLPAPRAALRVLMAHHPRTRGAAPRLDQRGFPMDPKDRAARRDRLRARAVTTTVVATVVAAPVLALWAAYRGTPVGEAEDGRPASAGETHAEDGPAGGNGGYENAGNAGATRGDRTGGPDVSVEVLGVAGAGRDAGRLEVSAGHRGDTTLITLAATGRSPVRWSASTTAPWLYLSQYAGTLGPGETLTVRVHVDHLREPSGRWTARVALAPVGAVVTIDGYGTAPGPSRPAPRPSRPGIPSPSGPDPTPTTSVPPTAVPSGTPTPTDPHPTPTVPSPTGTGGSSPPPGDTGGPGPAAR
ncbi:hypothetical protein [Streptomyces ziwulingensis]|uniref:BACON domain-containing protein n=1 Tax=Streptomyces ziwulingensis TaxID=1045501 RepID=A0ABP9D778_9ACTN